MNNHFTDLGLQIDKRNRIQTNNAMGFMFLGSNKIREDLKSYAHPGCVIADIGCAYGIDTITLAQGGAQVTAIDLDPTHLAAIPPLLTQEEQERVTLICAQFPSSCSLEAKAFDAILLSRLLIFLKPEDLKTVFQSVHQALKPDGKIFIVNATPFSERWDRIKKHYDQHCLIDPKAPFFVPTIWELLPVLKAYFPPHILLFDQLSLTTCLESAGFTVLDSGYMTEEGTVDVYAIATPK